MKDVPTEIPAGLEFAAILQREDVRDILASRDNRKIEQMPKGARIGTGSLRRSAQLLDVLPDAVIVPLRGNLDTRLRKIETEKLDGVIVAAAGMKRMGFVQRITQFLPVELMLPAVGQGALGLEVRTGDNELKKILARINHAPTNTEIAAERAFLRCLGGGCRLPIAALGKLEGDKLSLEGLVASPQGSGIIRDKVKGTVFEAEELGKELAGIILERGGKKLLDLV
jgi:hydroxymethylbilane synthase